MPLVLAVVAALAASVSIASETRVSDPEAARKAVRDAAPGDVVVLAAGEWRDVDLRLDGEGTAENPIVIRAERPGETVLTGASRIRLGGSHLVVSGLWLKNLAGAKSDWLEFRIDSKRRANHCRLTDCALTEDPDFAVGKEGNRWIGIYGEGNQVDRCTLRGKKNEGATVVVWLGESDPGRHRILANHFGERPRLGRNGGETIRIGDSKTSMSRAECLVEGNLFFRCDGEAECISNKSGGNIYRGNYFVETQGTLTLRHGNDCLVEGNRFWGRNRAHTGGIRVIGEGHRVVGNMLQGLEGDGFRSALCLVTGIPESPDHGYHQVKGGLLEGNRVHDCREALLIGYNEVESATLPPSGVRFAGNVIVAREGRPAVRVAAIPEETVWEDNAIRGEWIGWKAREGGRELRPDDLAPFPETGLEMFGASWLGEG